MKPNGPYQADTHRGGRARVAFTLEPLLVDDVAAGRLLGIGASFFRQLEQRGVIGPMPILWGKRRLHRVDTLREWVRVGMPDRKTWLTMNGGE